MNANLTFTKYNLPNLVKMISCLTSTGKITRTNTGYIYADIDNEFIHRSFALLKNTLDINIQKPDYFSLDTDFIGAHISLVYPEENQTSEADFFDAQCHFSVEDIFSTVLDSKTYYGLKIVSQDITQFRKNLGLPEFLSIKGHTVFPHITIAVSKDT